MAEYINMITVSALTANLFLGGCPRACPSCRPAACGSCCGSSLKTLGVILVFFWLRATVPRFRYDQLMDFGWKVLLPLAPLNVLATAGFLVLSK